MEISNQLQEQALPFLQQYGRVYPIIVRLSQNLGLSRFDASLDGEDIAQSVALSILEQGKDYREVEDAYWVKSASNRVFDTLRRERTRVGRILRLSKGFVTESALERTASNRVSINKELASLPDRWRMAILLQYMYGFNLEESAQILRTTCPAIKGVRTRSIRQLRVALSD